MEAVERRIIEVRGGSWTATPPPNIYSSGCSCYGDVQVLHRCRRWRLLPNGVVEVDTYFTLSLGPPGAIERRPIWMDLTDVLLRNGQVVIRIGPRPYEIYRFPLSDPTLGNLAGMVCLAVPSTLGPSFPHAFFALYKTPAGAMWQRVFFWGSVDRIPAGTASLNHIEAFYITDRLVPLEGMAERFCLTILRPWEDGSAEVLWTEVIIGRETLQTTKVAAKGFRFLQAFPIPGRIYDALEIRKIGLLGLRLEEGHRARLILQVLDARIRQTIQEADLGDLVVVSDPERVVARVLPDRGIAVLYGMPGAAVVSLPDNLFAEGR